MQKGASPTVHNPGKCYGKNKFNEVTSALHRGNRADSTGLFSRQSYVVRKAYGNGPEGEEVELAPRKINVIPSRSLEWAPPEVVIDVHCPPEHMYVRWQNDVGTPWAAEPIWSGYAATKCRPVHPAGRTPLRKLQGLLRRELGTSS